MVASRIVPVAVVWAAWLAVGPGCGRPPDVAPVEPLIGTITFEREIVLGDTRPVEFDIPPYTGMPYNGTVYGSPYHVLFPAGAAAAGTRITVRGVIGLLKTLPDHDSLLSDNVTLQIAPRGIIFAKPAQLTFCFCGNSGATANGFHALSAREDDAAWTIIGEGPWNVPTGGTQPNPTGGPPLPFLAPPIATVSVSGSGLWTAASYQAADGGVDGGQVSDAGVDADGG